MSCTDSSPSAGTARRHIIFSVSTIDRNNFELLCLLVKGSKEDAIYPQMLGDECPEGTAVFQSTCLAGPNSMGGSSASAATPEPPGPRYCGQDGIFFLGGNSGDKRLETGGPGNSHSDEDISSASRHPSQFQEYSNTTPTSTAAPCLLFLIEILCFRLSLLICLNLRYRRSFANWPGNWDIFQAGEPP